MKLLYHGLLGAIALLGTVLFALPANSQPPRSYGYGAAYQHKYVQQNDFIIGIPVAPDYYYSVGEGETPEERDQRIAEAVIKKFEERFQLSGNDEPKQQQPEQVTGNLFNLVGGSGKTEPTVKAPDIVGINRRVQTLFNSTCIKCHKPGANKPGRIQLLSADRKLFTESDHQKEYARRIRVYESVESGEMPKGGPVLPAGSKALLKEWLSLAQAKK